MEGTTLTKELPTALNTIPNLPGNKPSTTSIHQLECTKLDDKLLETDEDTIVISMNIKSFLS